MRWSASDPDGDSLEIAVDYSRHGGRTWRTMYADDLVILVKGTRDQAAALLGQLARRLQAIGLQLKPEMTAITKSTRVSVPRPADHPPRQGTEAPRLHPCQ